MNQINWGMIGCGDVTEVKSGPAFSKINQSKLVAVMRRNAAKAADYAKRHHVPNWYCNADDLINNPKVNAIYIATPPDSHEAYALKAIAAGKPVYVEKPMTLNSQEAINISKAAKAAGVKLTVAHYRRGQPYFKKIRSLLEEKAIGDIRFVRMSLFAPLLSEEALQEEKTAWRVDPKQSGGGLFHDIAPHQLDLMYWMFGEAELIGGLSTNQSKRYNAPDIYSGSMLFKTGVLFGGLWSFNVSKQQALDRCEIIGTKGSISFSVFGEQYIHIIRDGNETIIPFTIPMHVQQPMIEEVVDYFLDRGLNPCSAEEGVIVMDMIDRMTERSYNFQSMI